MTCSYFKNCPKSSQMFSQPGHLHTPWPYRGWVPPLSSCSELEDSAKEKRRLRIQEVRQVEGAQQGSTQVRSVEWKKNKSEGRLKQEHLVVRNILECFQVNCSSPINVLDYNMNYFKQWSRSHHPIQEGGFQVNMTNPDGHIISIRRLILCVTSVLLRTTGAGGAPAFFKWHPNKLRPRLDSTSY